MYKEKLEKLVDKIIPYLLIILLLLILAEFLIPSIHDYQIYITLFDSFLVLVFITDLYFKYQHCKNIPQFLRRYWIEIIATLPFFLIFRVFEEFGLLRAVLSETAQQGQSLAHVGLNAQREISLAEREIVAAERTLRGERLFRFLRPVLRLPRFARTLHFFSHPK
ncbi:MAG TPA: hypothetical protein VK158_03445 [Acidobacteriota bacterium]|nr:hypothetical protein [Acidobacteriota bacterium]